MDSITATVERKRRTISVKRNDRGGGQAAQIQLDNEARAIFAAMWSRNQQRALTTLETRFSSVQELHEANPGAKEAPTRIMQIDALSARVDTQHATQRKAAQAIADAIAYEDSARVFADDQFQQAMEGGNPVTVVEALKDLQKKISPVDSDGDRAQALAMETEVRSSANGQDIFQFFEKMKVSVSGIPGLMIRETMPGPVSDAQKAFLARVDARLVLFLTLMNLSSETHVNRLQYELAMDSARLAALPPAEYTKGLLTHLAGLAPAVGTPATAALSHGQDDRKRLQRKVQVPRLENGDVDMTKILCFKCQSFGHFRMDCPGVSEKKATSGNVTFAAIKELQAEMKSMRKSMQEVEAATANYAYEGGDDVEVPKSAAKAFAATDVSTVTAAVMAALTARDAALRSGSQDDDA